MEISCQRYKNDNIILLIPRKRSKTLNAKNEKLRWPITRIVKACFDEHKHLVAGTEFQFLHYQEPPYNQ